MKKLFGLICAIMFTVSLAGNAMAVPFVFGDGSTGANGSGPLQVVLDDIAVDNDSDIDVVNDSIADALDSYWEQTALGASGAGLIVELAGFKDTNLFGIYQGTQYVELFDGAASAGDKAFLEFDTDGSVLITTGGVTTDSGIDFNTGIFGFYLDSSSQSAGGLFHSDTARNDDGMDHMVAYQGVGEDTLLPGNAFSGDWTDNEFVLAFEDLYGPYSTADRDFTDFVVMVESVQPAPVPEPATMLLLGSGLIGMIGFKRKKSSNS